MTSKIFEQYDKHGKQKVTRSKKTLYVLYQSPINVWKYLTHKLIASRILHYYIDLCLFINDKVRVIVCDEIIFWAKDESKIHGVSNKNS